MTVKNQYLSSFVSSFTFNSYNLGEDKMEQQTPFFPEKRDERTRESQNVPLLQGLN